MGNGNRNTYLQTNLEPLVIHVALFLQGFFAHAVLLILHNAPLLPGGQLKNKRIKYYKINPLADPKGAGGHQGRVLPPSPGPNSFIFMQFSAKKLQNNPNLGVGAPPRENPGSVTVTSQKKINCDYLSR